MPHPLRPCLAALCAALLAPGCGDKDDEDTGASGVDGTLQCGTTHAFVSGFITGSDAPTLAGRHEDGTEVTADWYGDPGDEGVPFEINLAEGAWVLSASADGCSTDSSVLTAAACSEYTMSFALTCE